MIRRPRMIAEEQAGSTFLPLTIELIPQSSWYKNVRKQNPKQWTAIKNIAKAKHCRCEICRRKFGSSFWNQRDVHESFTYDAASKVQTLSSLMVICHACHMAKHPGFMATDTTDEGKRRYNYIVTHACKVNNIQKDEYMLLLQKAMDIWTLRSKINWTVDLSLANRYVEENES